MVTIATTRRTTFSFFALTATLNFPLAGVEIGGGSKTNLHLATQFNMLTDTVTLACF